MAVFGRCNSSAFSKKRGKSQLVASFKEIQATRIKTDRELKYLKCKMNLSEYSSEVVGFDSTWDQDKEVLVKDAATDVMSIGIQLLDKLTTTTETREIGVRLNLTHLPGL